MKRIVALAGIILIFGVCSAWAQKTVQLSIATGGIGGVYYPIGKTMANIISTYIPYAGATSEVTTASVDNCLLIGLGRVDLALIMADSGWNAYQGKGTFKERMPLRTLTVLYPNNMHIVTLGGKGIEQVMDLKGKRVSTGAERSGTEVMALRLLDSYGINADKQMIRKKLGASESAEALKEGKIDAYFWVGGLPTPSVLSLGSTPGIKIKFVGHGNAVPKMTGKYGPLYTKGNIPAKTYPGQDEDIPIAVVWNLLVCHQKMRQDLAYDIVKVLFDHKSELARVHRDGRFLSMECQKTGFPSVPFHPGAIRYFKEKGQAFE